MSVKKIREAVAAAPEHEPGPERLVLPEGAPVGQAEEFVARHYRRDNKNILLCHQRTFYRWTTTHWSQMGEAQLRHELYAFLSEAFVKKSGALEPFRPTNAKVGEVVHALRAMLYIDDQHQPPLWLVPDKSAADLVACQNGILNIRTRELTAHTPDFFSTTCLPLAYDAEASFPEQWGEFLRQLWPDDEEAEAVLGEIMGYLISGETRLHKIFLIVGPPRAGKGTIARVITKLLGDDNVVATTLHDLNNDFGRWALIDKSLAIAGDARLSGRTERLAEHLLSISGGDMQTINRKLQSFWTGYLGVRFLLLSNELPHITDASSTLPSRFVVLQLKETWLGREDTELEGRLLAELPGILLWALDSLDALRARGRFVQPKSSRAAIRDMQDMASPLRAFVRDWCRKADDAECAVDEFYGAYRAWAEDAGHRMMSKTMVTRTLHSLLPKVRTVSSNRHRRHRGVELSEKGRDSWEELLARGRR